MPSIILMFRVFRAIYLGCLRIDMHIAINIIIEKVETFQIRILDGKRFKKDRKQELKIFQYF